MTLNGLRTNVTESRATARLTVPSSMRIVGGDEPSWLKVIVRPATVMVPMRGELLGFASTRKPTLPLPLPEEPDVIVIHETLLWAVQGQALGPVEFTPREPVFPAAPIFRLDGMTMKVVTKTNADVEISPPQEFETMKS